MREVVSWPCFNPRCSPVIIVKHKVAYEAHLYTIFGLFDSLNPNLNFKCLHKKTLKM